MSTVKVYGDENENIYTINSKCMPHNTIMEKAN